MRYARPSMEGARCASPSEEPTEYRALLLRPEEAARLLRISERMLWTLTDRGELGAVWIGRAKRYDYRDLREFVDRRKADGRKGARDE